MVFASVRCMDNSENRHNNFRRKYMYGQASHLLRLDAVAYLDRSIFAFDESVFNVYSYSCEIVIFLILDIYGSRR